MDLLPGSSSSTVLLVALAVLASCASCEPADDAVAPPPSARVGPPAPGAPGLDGGTTREQHDATPPGPPGRVVHERRQGAHVVSWDGTRDDTIAGYRVYRRSPGAAWTEAGFVALHADDPRNRGAYRFEDRSAQGDLEYTVAAVDPAGRAGPKHTEID